MQLLKDISRPSLHAQPVLRRRNYKLAPQASDLYTSKRRTHVSNAVQFYGTNEGTSPIFFGDASSKKFGTYFVKDGKVKDQSRPRCLK